MDNSFDKKLLLLPQNMLSLYARGAFPMADENNELDWYFPEVRTVIPINTFKPPRSLRKFIEKSDFIVRFNVDVMRVVKECANRSETWISDELIEAYKGLLNLGHLHSVEVYQHEELVGGLYGVAFNGAFFGESMFSRVSQASKTALVHLVYQLKKQGFLLLDVQYVTDHLQMFGAMEIPLQEYEALRLDAIALEGVTFTE